MPRASPSFTRLLVRSELSIHGTTISPRHRGNQDGQVPLLQTGTELANRQPPVERWAPAPCAHRWKSEGRRGHPQSAGAPTVGWEAASVRSTEEQGHEDGGMSGQMLGRDFFLSFFFF